MEEELRNMSAKYEAIAVAYRNIPKEVRDKFYRYSVGCINEMSDIEEIKGIQGRTMDINSRVGIYVSWFEEKIKEKLKEGYIVDILELPFSYKSQVELLEKLDIKHGEDLLILEKVDV